jgi:proteasome lid subunit RPN8/RPN11
MPIRWRDETVLLPSNPVSALAAADADVCASAAAPGGRFRVVVDERAGTEALAHLGRVSIERGGLLLGTLYHDDADASRTPVAACVEAVVPGHDATGSAVSLRLEAGVWSAARERLAPGQVVLGWYHSHPGLGAFFSATDRHTQRAFFRQPWSLGWVIDPTRGAQAWFLGPESEPLSGFALHFRASRASVPAGPSSRPSD